MSGDHAPFTGLSRRESQVMATLYRLERATAATLLRELPDLPSYSAIRSTLRVLQEKGRVKVVGAVGSAHEYAPVGGRESAARSAAALLLTSFFAGDVRRAVSTLLHEADLRLSEDELKRIERTIDRAERRQERE